MRPLSLAVLLTVLAFPLEVRADEATAIHAANKKLGRGINLGNALEADKEGDWGVRLEAGYFETIKQAGFDTVRLPIKWSAHAARTAPYTIDAVFAKRVDWAIDQAVANKLNIIVNVHHYGEMDAEPDKHLARLEGLWMQIADRYKDRPASVYLELLNEPHDKLTPEKWNAMIPKLLAIVWKTNPTRPVIVGPGNWNAIWTLPKLELPRDDRNLIVTVHSYDPFPFTHQSAPWVKNSAKYKGTKWKGTADDQAALRKSLESAAAWGKKNDRPIFLGEFGAYEAADMESRARWTLFVSGEATKLRMSWTYWEFCSGFGAYDSKAKAWRKPLLDALVR